VAQAIELLLCKCETLISNPIPTKEEEEEDKEEEEETIS
jgi:hypothetical protein